MKFRKGSKRSKKLTSCVPDINDDCIKKTISSTFLSIGKFQAANETISNQIRSKIRRVHGTKHNETKIFTNGPNDKNNQTYSETIYSYNLKKRYQCNSEKDAKDQKTDHVCTRY